MFLEKNLIQYVSIYYYVYHLVMSFIYKIWLKSSKNIVMSIQNIIFITILLIIHYSINSQIKKCKIIICNNRKCIYAKDNRSKSEYVSLLNQTCIKYNKNISLFFLSKIILR